jgi:hypothetical protein
MTKKARKGTLTVKVKVLKEEAEEISLSMEFSVTLK